ncbi:nucleoside-diphosphate sugar epimerase [Paenibacillus sp. YYML68]|uniref:nucleoside-diphosphate sugar epimerase n=1 Tax=Paenibacillus sp. YYML68 TaxID=2909250 RepID=UPI00248F5F58|nr:nucleoside-diphosphate sugar epimerase [Paenibacillus sp. YYML68]
MQQKVTEILAHMATSQQEIANILEAKRQVAVRMAQQVHDIPPEQPAFEDVETLTYNAMNVSKSIAAYLNGLSDLSDALADNLAYVLKELETPSDEE